MAHLRPKRLEIEGFRSFKDRAIFEFPDDGMVLIAGKWDGSSASSGSGKSALLMAMAFILDICDVPATDLKNWDSKKIDTLMVLTDGQNEYLVRRDPKLSLVINGTPYEGQVKGAKEKLAEILRTSPSLVKDLTYREQRVRGKLITSTDAQKKEFLSELCNLEPLEQAYEMYNREQSVLESAIGILNAEVDTMRTMATSAVVPQFQVEQAAAALVEAEGRLKQLGSGSSQEIQAKIDNAQVELSRVAAVESQIARATNENATMRNQIMSLRQEIDMLQKSICPTCRREWDIARESIAAKEVTLQDMLKRFEVNMALIKNAKPIIDNGPALRLIQSQAYEELGKLRAPLQDAVRARDSAQATLNSYHQRINQYTALQKNVSDKVQAIADKKTRLDVVMHCSKILGRNGFMGSIFDELLQEIESRANDMISYLPNVSRYTISFSSTSIAKTTGNAKKEITTKIFKDGHEASYKSLSGGQQVSLELCADLAYAMTVRSRSGSPLGWICLDEAMEGYGVEEKQAALEMIKTKVKGLVLVIDHATEIKEGFEKIIEIRYNGRESRVVS